MNLSHREAQRALHAVLDGQASARLKMALEQHLAVCADCQRAAEKLNALDDRLAQSLQRRWHLPAPSERKVSAALARIPPQTRKPSGFVRSARSAAWVALTIALLLALIWGIKTFVPQPMPAVQPTAIPMFQSPTATPPAVPTVQPPTATPTELPTPMATLGPTPTAPSDISFTVFNHPELSGKIAFKAHPRWEENPTELYVINADGTGLKRLTYNWREEDSPAFSPDGKQLAFVSNNELYVINADGSGQTKLSSNVESYYGSPWSPDGKKIVFKWWHLPDFGIFTINTDGSSKTKVYDRWADYLVWSPDSLKIAFMDYSHIFMASSHIFVVNADGTGLKQLTNDEQLYFNTYWSPDNKIKFCSCIKKPGTPVPTPAGDGMWTQDDPCLSYSLSEMNADGTERVQLVSDSQLVCGWGSFWSPDGQKFAWVGSSGLNVINVDGSGKTFLKGIDTIMYGYAWSPDSTKIVGSTGTRLFICDSDGSTKINLLAGGDSLSWFAWGP